jgi:hypothetical protein
MPPKDAYLSRAGLAEKPQTSIDKTALSRIDLLPPPDYFIFEYCLWGMRAMSIEFARGFSGHTAASLLVLLAAAPRWT